MNLIRITSILLSLSLFLSSCSTIFNSGTQTLIARSNNGEEGIKIEVTTPSGSYPAKLPATIAAEPHHDGVNIKVADKCYDPTTAIVKKNITPSFWANFLWFGAFWVGMGIDAITGKMWKYDTNVSVPVSQKEECEKKEQTKE